MTPHRRQKLIAVLNLFCLTLLIAQPARGQTAPAAAPVPQTLEQADEQRARATQMRSDSEKRLAEEQAACHKKFLVNSCLDDAKKRHTQSMIDARKLDTPARDFQREAKRAEVEAKEKQRAADNAQRAIDQKEEAATYRSAEAAKAADRERKKAAKAQQAAEGRQKRAAEDAKRQEKQEKRAKKDAERAEKKAREDAKAATKSPLQAPAP